jgi:hypothetical protein
MMTGKQTIYLAIFLNVPESALSMLWTDLGEIWERNQ